MKYIYDNGYYLLGQVDKVIEYYRENVTTSDMEEQVFDMIKELEEDYNKEDIVSIYYENPMGYTIEKWDAKDIVNKNMIDIDYIVNK